MQKIIGVTLILTFLLSSCGDIDGGSDNQISVRSSVCEREGDKYVCHIEPGGGSDPEVKGIDDTGKAKRDIWKESIIFHGQATEKNDELWSSSRCMSPEKEKAMFSTDGRLRVRVVPRLLPSKAVGNKDYDDCGTTAAHECKEVIFNYGKMNIKVGVKKPVDTEWTQTVTFREIGINKASPVMDFQIPGGIKSGESLQLGILSVESDEYCRALVDQGYNSESYEYFNRYCPGGSGDMMAVAAVKCAKIELQVVNDHTKNFP